MIGKIINQQGKYKRVTLTDIDTAEAQKELRDDNLDLMADCLKDASVMVTEYKKMLELNGAEDNVRTFIVVQLAKALFDKLATQSFTLYKEKLNQKVFRLKNHNQEG